MRKNIANIKSQKNPLIIVISILKRNNNKIRINTLKNQKNKYKKLK